MFTRAEIRELSNVFAPKMLSTVSNTSATETVILPGPVDVFAIGISNTGGVAQTYDFKDGTNAVANNKIFFGTVAGNAEEFFSIAPAAVRFDTEVRMVTSLANTASWTIFYRTV